MKITCPCLLTSLHLCPSLPIPISVYLKLTSFIQMFQLPSFSPLLLSPCSSFTYTRARTHTQVCPRSPLCPLPLLRSRLHPVSMLLVEASRDGGDGRHLPLPHLPAFGESRLHLVCLCCLTRPSCVTFVSSQPQFFSSPLQTFVPLTHCPFLFPLCSLFFLLPTLLPYVSLLSTSPTIHFCSLPFQAPLQSVSSCNCVCNCPAGSWWLGLCPTLCCLHSHQKQQE